jgi:hypothetical protein
MRAIYLSIIVTTIAAQLGLEKSYAKPLETYSRLPVRRDSRRDAQIFEGLAASYGQTGANRTIKAALSTTDVDSVRKTLTRSVRVEEGAPSNLFQDSTLFHGLQTVVLEGELKNEEHLRLLAQRYPELKSLAIRQKTPLTLAALVSMRQFKSLQSLELWCPLSSELLAGGMPESLVLLGVHDRVKIPALPNLRWLFLRSSRLDHHFFNELRTPKLEVIHLKNVDLVQGALKEINKLSLREFVIDQSHIDDSELAYLKSNEHLELLIRNDWRRVAESFQKAEECFVRGNFAMALRHYDSSVFAKPSAVGYLQRARCLIHLGQRERAIQSCHDAMALEPSNPDIRLVEKQALLLDPIP